jgi:hypothetical protein
MKTARKKEIEDGAGLDGIPARVRDEDPPGCQDPPHFLDTPAPEVKPAPEGRKDDAGKLRWSLLPWPQVEQIVRVLEYGARKYAVDNWQLVQDPQRRYFDAATRHLIAWEREEDTDAESGLPHLAHAACCLLFLLHFEAEEP